jgi:predicted nucleic acid-binding protein
MSRILIDTNILIEFLRGNASVRNALQNVSDEHEAFCSVITVGELVAGMRPSEKSKTYALIEALQVVSVSFEIAELAGQWKAKIKSHSLSLDDCLIAATCYFHADNLYTFNKKHYPMKEVRFWREN